MEKIKTYKVGQRGLRGGAVTLPKIWMEDGKIKPGDVIEFFRDSKHELGDVVILRKANGKV